MTLVLDIEHLLGVAFAAREPASSMPDWPPQPDRVFSALVAAWGAHREAAEERRALEWLEAQPVPEIVASSGFPRTAPIVFVPPNDPESQRIADPAVLPERRRRQARRFPAFRPTDPVVSLVWREATPDPATLAALNALAADTAYIGHSASLTRCRFRDAGPVPSASGQTAAAHRRIYDGRLAELEREYCARPLRRPRPGPPAGTVPAAVERRITTVFSDRWLVLEHAAGEMPDLRAAPVVARALRHALMSGYRQIGLADAVPEIISGHLPDGRPTGTPHLAIVPLAFVGSPYASGAVYGFALVPPRAAPLFAEAGFQRALGALAPWDAAAGGRRLTLVSGALHLSFAITADSERRSLDPQPYCDTATLWASATPIVLDRHLKAPGNAERAAEVAEMITRACANIGLPTPMRVAAGKHSALEGAPGAYPSAREPRLMRWRLPGSLASRQLTHAVIEFSEPVHGPVILGAGRFVGLGLCRPLRAGARSR